MIGEVLSSTTYDAPPPLVLLLSASLVRCRCSSTSIIMMVAVLVATSRSKYYSNWLAPCADYGTAVVRGVSDCFV